jgi:alpha-D-xyloside xylohydrolase
MVAGGQDSLIAAPYERIPVYVRAGAIVPIDLSCSIRPRKSRMCWIFISMPEQTVSFHSMKTKGAIIIMKKGKYSRIDFSYDNSEQILSLASRQRDFDGMLTKRKFNIIFVSDRNAVGLDVSSAKSTVVTYAGKALQVKLK